MSDIAYDGLWSAAPPPPPAPSPTASSPPSSAAPEAVTLWVAPMDRPWLWLEQGWEDLTRAPVASLSYGLASVAASWGATYATTALDLEYLLLPMLAGFALIAPFGAVGLYEISRRLDVGDAEPVSLVGSFAALGRHATELGLMGLLLLMLFMIWVRSATLLFAVFFATSEVSLGGVVDAMMLRPESPLFLVVGTLVGGAFAVVAFLSAAVSIPMLVHRNVTVMHAVVTSFKVCRANWPAMALWAGLIAAFTAVGLATFYVGLAVLLPLVGHATWRAYRDLVRDVAEA